MEVSIRLTDRNISLSFDWFMLYWKYCHVIPHTVAARPLVRYVAMQKSHRVSPGAQKNRSSKFDDASNVMISI